MIKLGSTISNRWTVIERIGNGGQGRVYMAMDSKTGSLVAIKVRMRNHMEERLYNEAFFLGEISEEFENEESSITPSFHTYKQQGNEELLIMDLMGPSLETHFKQNYRNISGNELISIFKKAVSCLEKLHSIGIVHRDIKPDNLCFAPGQHNGNLYLIDFGLASYYSDRCSGEHYEHTWDNGFVGTEMYASLNQHMGGSPCRKDDLESLCYSMMELECGNLPWATVEASDVLDKYGQLLKWKSEPARQICENYPKYFYDILKYIEELPYKAAPSYSYIQGLLDEALEESFAQNFVSSLVSGSFDDNSSESCTS